MTEADAVLGVILARGGSVRIPRKNIKELGGKPLVAWTIEAAKNAKSLDYFLVSTNDDEIAKISKAWGAPVPFRRPAEISEDVDSVFALIHAVKKYEKKKQRRVGYVVALQPTSPFRTSDDIDTCVQIAKTTGVDSVVSVTKVSQHPAWCFELKPFGHEIAPFMDVKLQGENLVSQNLPLLLYPNGAVYVVRRDVVMSERIFGDKIYGYMMPRERSVDIEEEFDFLVCSALIPYLQDKEPYAKMSWVIS